MVIPRLPTHLRPPLSFKTSSDFFQISSAIPVQAHTFNEAVLFTVFDYLSCFSRGGSWILQ